MPPRVTGFALRPPVPAVQGVREFGTRLRQGRLSFAHLVIAERMKLESMPPMLSRPWSLTHGYFVGMVSGARQTGIIVLPARHYAPALFGENLEVGTACRRACFLLPRLVSQFQAIGFFNFKRLVFQSQAIGFPVSSDCFFNFKRLVSRAGQNGIPSRRAWGSRGSRLFPERFRAPAFPRRGKAQSLRLGFSSP